MRFHTVTRGLTVLLALVVAALSHVVLATPASAAPTYDSGRDSGNPVLDRSWGVNTDSIEAPWDAYRKASGQQKAQLGRIALAPKTRWFTDELPTKDVADRVSRYIRTTQNGNPEALVQMTVYRMDNWRSNACKRRTAAQVRDYKRWINTFARTVGKTPTVIVLQPDAPRLLCGGRTKPQLNQLMTFAAKRFSSLPRTSVYIDAGAGDWPSAGQGGVSAVLKFLVPAGIRHTRGFALNSTHYSGTREDVARGAAIVQALNRRGIRNKKFVVNTSSNGRPVVYGRFKNKFAGASNLNADHVPACRTPKDKRLCITLGIPPTTDVASPRWKLPNRTRRLANKHVDAYLWFGRPWNCMQAAPFMTKRAVQLVRSSPFRTHLPTAPATRQRSATDTTAGREALSKECRRW